MANTTDQLYSDLCLNLTPNPVTGDVVVKTGTDAITQAVRTLVMTNFYERPFHWDIGSNARAHLFENFSPLTSQLLTMYIRRALANDEPRAVVMDVKTTARPDSNGLHVKLTYRPAHLTQPVIVDVFLQRVR